MHTTRTRLSLLLLLALSGLRSGIAADADAAAPALVLVTGHYDNAVGTSDAASQGAVTAGLIENRPRLRTGELLEFVPGMIVTQHSGDGKANQYFLRGFNLDHGTDFATHVDGIPVNMRSHAHGQGYTDLNFLIPELVKRIEYKKGTYFADEGDFASAGAARIVLADSLPQGLASVSAGSFGYRRGVVADSMPAAGGTLLAGLEFARNDGPWQVPERLRKVAGVLRYSAGTADDGVNLTAMAYRSRWQATDQIPLRAVAAGRLDRFGSLNPTDGGDTARASLSFALRKRTGGPDGAGRFDFNAYAVRSSLDLFSDFTYALAHPEGGDQFEQRERRTMVGANASQSWPATVGGLALRNRIGVQLRHDRVAPAGLYETAARVRTATVREDRVRESSVGVFAESTVHWTPWFRSVAGLRYDAYRFAIAGADAANGGSTRDGIASPKLSLVGGPWRDTELFANIGTGFHSNDARGTLPVRLADGTRSEPATPLVRTRGRELGIRTEAVPGLQSSAALWRLDIGSELVFVGDAGTTEPGRASRRTGIEWNNHYIAAPWLLFDLDLAVSRARYTQHDPAGDRIPGSLDRVVSFGMTVKDRAGWDAGFQLRHFGPRPLVEDGSVRSAATTLAYLRAGYRLGRRTRIDLDVFNLFDRAASDIDYYYRSRLPGEAADGMDDVHFHPVEPRSFRVTLTYNF